MNKAVGAAWVLNELAGMSFQGMGAAYDFMKKRIDAQEDSEESDVVAVTERQMVAMLASAPIDNYRSENKSVLPGHVTPFESSAAADVRDRYERHGFAPSAVDLSFARSLFARVFGLPAAPHDGAGLVMRAQWTNATSAPMAADATPKLDAVPLYSLARGDLFEIDGVRGMVLGDGGARREVAFCSPTVNAGMVVTIDGQTAVRRVTLT